MEPRPAATVVVVRPGPRGVEVLMLRRAPDTPFAAGFVVFPGGMVDDADADLAERWFDDAGDAARACAVRELAEEAGLVMGGDGVRLLGPGEDPVEALGASPPRMEDIHPMARWLAPEFLAVRFDAEFFSVGVPDGIEPIPDGREIDRGWWARPADVLDEFPLWRALMWPTYRTLEHLASCGTVEEVLALRVEQEMPPPSLLALRVSPEWQERGG
ncbi:MAG TPA: NUDIX domain-containing protein [Actinomycetota bacterium]